MNTPDPKDNLIEASTEDSPAEDSLETSVENFSTILNPRLTIFDLKTKWLNLLIPEDRQELSLKSTNEISEIIIHESCLLGGDYDYSCLYDILYEDISNYMDSLEAIEIDPNNVEFDEGCTWLHKNDGTLIELQTASDNEVEVIEAFQTDLIPTNFSLNGINYYMENERLSTTTKPQEDVNTNCMYYSFSGNLNGIKCVVNPSGKCNECSDYEPSNK